MTLAYFITFTCYGTWLHGDDRGSWWRNAQTLREYFVPPDPKLVESMRRRMKHPATSMNGPMRKCVREGIVAHCQFKGWVLHALAVRTNHVHVVVTTTTHSIQQVMVAIKARSTLLLREAGHHQPDQPMWTERASKVQLDSQPSFAGAVHYVLHNQGPELPDE
jgi:REP element-mobilizing transposase RayT